MEPITISDWSTDVAYKVEEILNDKQELIDYLTEHIQVCTEALERLETE